MKRLLIFCTVISLSANVFSQAKKAPVKKVATKAVAAETIKSNDTLIEITTNYGVMIARLYNNTPQHRDNFIKLVRQGVYDSLLFHRVIRGFMLQGGDPASKNADGTTMLGGGEVPNVPMVSAEFNKNLIHKKGALAAARTENPEKKSSNCQFYIVQGNKVADTAQLANGNYTSEQKEIYQRIGGTPFLDQNYTVFGEVYIGLDVIDKIAAVKCGNGDRPVEDVRMKIRIIK
ncbi:MAG: peptidylprolyl isomerase [Bacteroidetes bacterium]|jgi:peptidyl-prolyl cis-trans isomerase B (cyclophilin B)|nr:peptidylprolyl isomerase [Bacteroidota bacterium]